MSDSEEEDFELKEKGMIRLNLKYQDTAPIQFVLKPTTKFEKLQNMYTEKQGVHHNAYSYWYEGQRLETKGNPGLTIKMLELFKPGRTYLIEANDEQIGG